MKKILKSLRHFLCITSLSLSLGESYGLEKSNKALIQVILLETRRWAWVIIYLWIIICERWRYSLIGTNGVSSYRVMTRDDQDWCPQMGFFSFNPLRQFTSFAAVMVEDSQLNIGQLWTSSCFIFVWKLCISFERMYYV